MTSLFLIAMPRVGARAGVGPLVAAHKEEWMRKIASLGIAAAVMIAAIVAWATATSYSGSQSALVGAQVNPFEMMKSAKDLPAHQYDAF
jgi:hypothetical protein